MTATDPFQAHRAAFAGQTARVTQLGGSSPIGRFLALTISLLVLLLALVLLIPVLLLGGLVVLGVVLYVKARRMLASRGGGNGAGGVGRGPWSGRKNVRVRQPRD